ncbi:MAG: hypothetical protein HXY26_09435 [Hydrogenophilaceae bacterium]|nr:hypothetical protein [Hydrogenophilaceae bacterium]
MSEHEHEQVDDPELVDSEGPSCSLEDDWPDEFTDMYLRAEEVWPDGMAIRELFLQTQDGLVFDSIKSHD